MRANPRRALAATLPGRVARDSLILAPSYIVPGLASLLAIPLLFAPLGANGYGTWALAYAIANGVPVVTSSWLEAISVRFGHRGSRAGALSYAASLLSSCLAAAVLAFALIPRADWTIVGATVLFTAAVVAYLLAQARLQARLAFGAMSRSAAIRAVAGAALSVGAAFATASPAAAAVGAAIGFGIGTGVAIPGARRPVEVEATPTPGTLGSPGDQLGASLPPAGQLAARSGELSFGAASAIVALAAYVLSVGDRFVLSAVRPLAEVGTYAATYAVIDLLVRLAPSIVFGVVRPRLFRAWDRGDRTRAAEAVGTLAVLLAWSAAAIAALGVVLTELTSVTRLDPLLAGPIAAGLGAFVVGNAVALVYASGERQARQAAHVVAGAILNIALNVLLDGTMGAVGAGLATAVSYLFVLALNVGGLMRVLPPRAVRDGAAATVTLMVAGLGALAGPVPGTIAAGLACIAVLARAAVAWSAWRTAEPGAGSSDPGSGALS